MRILLVHECPSAGGGAERYLDDIGRALSRRGYELAVLSARGGTPNSFWGVTYSISPSEGWRGGNGWQEGFRRVGELKHILLSFCPDVIFVQNSKNFLSPILLKIMASMAPCVQFVHDVRMVCPNETKIKVGSMNLCTFPAGLHCFYRNCCQSARESKFEAWKATVIDLIRLSVLRSLPRLIAPSHYIARELVRNGIEPGRIVVLPFFVKTVHVSAQPLPDSRILWVGHFKGGKGFEFFVDTLCKLLDLPWKAMVVGLGEGLSAARKLVEQKGLSSRFKFLGYLDSEKLQQCYSQACLLVITSTTAESFGIVGIEAMSQGRPVVAFRAGGISEWLEDGITGFTVPIGDTISMSQAIRKILTEPGSGEKMGIAGRSLVEARFKQDIHLAGLLSTFEAARRNWIGR